MTRLAWLTTCLAAAVALTLAPRASAQNVAPRYAPARPTMSPYLDLLRVSGGGVPNYYSIFRPDVQQRAFNQQQQQINQQQQSFSQQQLQFNQALERKVTQPNYVSENARPSGNSGGFMTHQRFFKTR